MFGWKNISAAEITESRSKRVSAFVHSPGLRSEVNAYIARRKSAAFSGKPAHPSDPGASGERNMLAGQSLIDCGSKVAAHLDPVFVSIRPGAKIKAHGSEGKVYYNCCAPAIAPLKPQQNMMNKPMRICRCRVNHPCSSAASAVLSAWVRGICTRLALYVWLPESMVRY